MSSPHRNGHRLQKTSHRQIQIRQIFFDGSAQWDNAWYVAYGRKSTTEDYWIYYRNDDFTMELVYFLGNRHVDHAEQKPVFQERYRHHRRTEIYAITVMGHIDFCGRKFKYCFCYHYL